MRRRAIRIGILLLALTLGLGLIAASVATLNAPEGSIQLTGTITEATDDEVVIAVSGAAKAGSLNASQLTARITSATKLDRVSRGSSLNRGLLVALAISAIPNADGSYNLVRLTPEFR